MSAWTLALPLQEQRKSALQRPGLHHSSIRGQFVTPEGDPVSGVRVYVSAGRPRALPLATTSTGPDGRFVFADVNTSYSPRLSWYPPEQWQRGARGIGGESSEDIDLGTIRLHADTVVRAAVEVVGGEPLEAGVGEPLVVLKSGNTGPRIVGERAGSLQVMRQVPFEDGAWEIVLHTKKGSEYFEAPFHTRRGRRDQMFLLRLHRHRIRQVNPYRLEGVLEVNEILVPPVNLERDFIAKGRVIAPDGTPVEGAVVHVNEFLLRNMAPQWTFSDAGGRFQLSYRSVNCRPPAVAFGQDDPWFVRRDSPEEKPCEQPWRSRDIITPAASRLVLQTPGSDPSSVRAYWWHESLGWRRFSSLQPWISLAGYRPMVVKLEQDGFVPIARELKLPRMSGRADEKPPAEISAAFRFDDRVRRELVILGSGKPIPGATVDLECIEDLDKDRRRLLDSYKTDARGRITLRGGGDQIVEVFVYVPGFEPHRAVWNPGTLLTLDLLPRSGTLSVKPLPSAFVARVRDAALPGAVRTVRLSSSESAILKVAPGLYDVTVYGNRGDILGYQRISVDAGQIREIDGTVDQRPRVTVRFPEGEWNASFSESTPPGVTTDWTAMYVETGPAPFSDKPATREQETPHQAVFMLSRAGRMHLQAGRKNQGFSLWRDIVVQAGESITVDVPPADAILKGSMHTYDGGLDLAIHGWAGPRMMLISDDPAGWSITEFLPRRDGQDGEAKHGFTIQDLPAGNYHLYQHLIGEAKTFLSAGRETHYVAPVAAWGGIPVRLVSGAVTQLRDFVEYPFRDLQVLVTDDRGMPLKSGTLRIRDRMSDAWRQVEENPAELEQASDPIPYPPAARLTGKAVTLPRVREGWLEVSVELDNGLVYDFTVAVSPPQVLMLKLPMRTPP